MIQLFCGTKGSGKTKALIHMANEKVGECEGNIVYIDDDSAMKFELSRKIRFVSTEDFKFNNFDSFYGFLCGIISEDYDIDSIFVDGLLNIVHNDLKDSEELFTKLNNLVEKFQVSFYINISCPTKDIPEFINEYIGA